MAEKPPDLTRGGARPSLFIEEARKRAIELLLIRGQTDHVVADYAKKKWSMSPAKISEIIKEIRDIWRKEWQGSPDRLDERLRAINSLKEMIQRAHSIISAEKKTTHIDKAANRKTVIRVYVHPPKIRLEAMRTAARLEAQLADIAGYAGDPEIPPPPPGEAPHRLPAGQGGVPGTVEVLPPAASPRQLGDGKTHTAYFAALKITERAE